MSDLKLKTEFPETSREDWRALAEKGLRGAPFETLISYTQGGVARGPLFDLSDRPEGIGPVMRRGDPHLEGRPWHIGAPVLDQDLSVANQYLLQDLAGGCSAAYINGPSLSRSADVRRLFEGVHTSLAPILFAPGQSGPSLVADQDDFRQATVILGLDPLSEAGDGAKTCPATWRPYVIDTVDIHEKGGTDIRELAIMSARLTEAFRQHGQDFAQAVALHIPVGPDAHLTLCKLRAARRLFAAIAEAFGVSGANAPIISITSLCMMQSEDAWTNMLRTMSAGFGAVTGGADYIILRPFTETPSDRYLGRPTEFAHRVARNQQLLMMEESRLGHVQDPAYGSYFHEKLTHDLAMAAWAEFQSIEERGGITAYDRAGDLDEDLAADVAAAQETPAPILGVTLHPAPDAPKPEVRS